MELEDVVNKLTAALMPMIRDGGEDATTAAAPAADDTPTIIVPNDDAAAEADEPILPFLAVYRAEKLLESFMAHVLRGATPVAIEPCCDFGDVPADSRIVTFCEQVTAEIRPKPVQDLREIKLPADAMSLPINCGVCCLVILETLLSAEFADFVSHYPDDVTHERSKCFVRAILAEHGSISAACRALIVMSKTIGGFQEREDLIRFGRYLVRVNEREIAEYRAAAELATSAQVIGGIAYVPGPPNKLVTTVVRENTSCPNVAFYVLDQTDEGLSLTLKGPDGIFSGKSSFFTLENQN